MCLGLLQEGSCPGWAHIYIFLVWTQSKTVMWLLSLASQDTDWLVFVCVLVLLLLTYLMKYQMLSEQYSFLVFFFKASLEEKNVFRYKSVPGLIAVLTVFWHNNCELIESIFFLQIWSSQIQYLSNLRVLEQCFTS